MQKTDWRNIVNGLEIPTVSYSDQPFVVKTDDNAWLCCVTTGNGHEGAPGQHVSTKRSMAQGKNWSTPVPVEALGSIRLNVYLQDRENTQNSNASLELRHNSITV